MHAKTLLLTLALAALLPTAAAATPDAEAEAPVEWQCDPGHLYEACVLVATVVTAVCYRVTGDYRKCPQ